MAEEGSVIKSFLIALGYKADEPALDKFKAGIATATKTVLALAAAVEAAAATVVIGVTRFANNLEQLYFSARRVGDSANNLKAFDRAMQNFGLSAGEGIDALEQMASFLRNNPGGESLLNTWGVQTRDIHGNLLGMTQLAVNFGKAMSAKPFFLANQMAGTIGISEKQLLALENGDVSSELERIRKEQSGTDWEKASKDAHRFMEEMRDLGTVLEAFGAQIWDAVQNSVRPTIGDLTTWIQTNGQRWAKDIAEAVKQILVWAKELVAYIKDVVIPTFEEYDRKSDGWIHTILAYGAALHFLGGDRIIGGLASLAGGLLTLAGAMTTVAGVGVGGGALAALLRVSGVVGAGVGLGYLWDKYFPGNVFAQMGEKFGDLLYTGTHHPQEAMASMSMLGWTQAQSAGIVENLLRENPQMNPNAQVMDTDHQIHRGIAMWDPERWGNLLKWAQANNRDPSQIETQLGFVNYEARQNPELMAAMKNYRNDPYSAGYLFSRMYEKAAGASGDRDIEANERGAASVKLYQNNVYHIDGAGDAEEVARRITHEQNRSAAELTRNLQPNLGVAGAWYPPMALPP